MINLILKGGLGNQLFQLSKFIFLKRNKNINNLKIDTLTGFLFDFKYKRKLEINGFRGSDLNANIFISGINIFLIYLDKYFPNLNKLLKIEIVNDINYKEINFNKKKFFILNGYFQDFNFISSNMEQIYKFIKPNFEEKYSNKFEKLYKKIKKTKNSVAICIRFYEESKNPEKHLPLNSKFKTYSQFNDLITRFEKSLKNPIFFIFVQNQNKFTDKLIFNSPSYFISHGKGYKGSWARLKAQALCKHHIFNNSTFYYWGAIFSKFLNTNEEICPKIYIADNFIFEEIYNPSWEKF